MFRDSHETEMLYLPSGVQADVGGLLHEDFSLWQQRTRQKGFVILSWVTLVAA